MRPLTFLIIICICSSLHAQSVSGHWYGIGSIQVDEETDQYLTEFNLIQKGNEVSGNLHYYFRDSLFTIKVSGSFNKEKRTLQFNQVPIVYYKYPDTKVPIMLNMDGIFQLRVAKAGSVLSGTVFNKDEKKLSAPLLTFKLKREDGFLAKKIASTADSTFTWTDISKGTETLSSHFSSFKKNDSIPNSNHLISTRTNQMNTHSTPNISVNPKLITAELFKARIKDYAKIIEVDNSNLKVELYDNGTIDYDSVSLFLNNEMVLPKTMLNHKSVKLNLQLNMDLEFNELGMFAENLGMIPPNTAAIIIHDGTKNYEINLNSDFNKNAIIQLKTKKQSPK